MNVRLLGLVPVFALMAVGAAHAQSTSGGGQMAYPDSLPSGQVKIPAPARGSDTGNMALPASPGGVTVASRRGGDVGNMALPTNRPPLTGSTSAAALTPAPSTTDAATTTPDATPAPAPVHRRHRAMRRRAARRAAAHRAAPAGSVDVPSSVDK